MRIPRIILENKVGHLNRALGLPLEAYTDGKANIGNIHLEKGFKGWSILQMVNNGGGCRHYLSNFTGLTSFEALLCLEAALAVAELRGEGAL